MSGKTLAVLQPGYIPWLGFFDQMRKSDVFVFYDDVQYDKHGWRNRNRIKSPSGPHWLTVPVLTSGKNLPLILETMIDNRLAWARKHVGTLRQFYACAPALEPYISEFEEILEGPWERLVDLDIAIIDWMIGHFGIATQLERSSQLKIEGVKNERLLDLCLHFEASTYLSGSAARDYLDVQLFERNGIKVEWQDYIHPQYPQLHGTFVSHLSTLDLLLNVGAESASVFFRNDS